MEIHTIGIDLGKTVFHFVGVNARGQVVVRKKGSRTQLLRFTANLPQCLIGMEACGGSHFPHRIPAPLPHMTLGRRCESSSSLVSTRRLRVRPPSRPRRGPPGRLLTPFR
jgi:hypothetical protein